MAAKENIYEYSKITRQGIIRLILLRPSLDLETELTCSVIEVSLKDSDNDLVEHYVALSYVWGDASQKGSINIDGKFLEITASLDLSLRHIRDTKKILRIWADGICINQEDIDDRNTQVTMMGDIYSIARHTIIFLGPSNEKHEPLLEEIADLGTLPEFKPDQQSVMSMAEDILAYPWFERVWILQELVVSPDPWVQIGRVRMRWDQFLRCMTTNKTEHPSAHGHQGLLQSMAQIRAKYHVRKHMGDKDSQGATILDILNARRGLGATDPRDMVYAHLGMSEPSVRSRIKVDYSKSKAQVYEDISRCIIAATKSVSVLSLVEDIDLETRPELPSWVPDLSLDLSLSQIQARKPLGVRQLGPELLDMGNVVPGVLAINGRYYGRIIYILPETLLPPYTSTISSTLINTGVSEMMEYEKRILECVFQPKSFDLVELLLRAWVQRSQTLTEHGSKHPLHQKYDCQLIPSDKKERHQNSVYDHITDKHIDLLTDLYLKLDPKTREEVEQKPAKYVIFLLCEGFKYLARCRQQYVRSDSSIFFCEKGTWIMMGILPVQTHINDIVALFSRHTEVFIVRSNEYEEVVAYKDSLRTAFTKSSLWKSATNPSTNLSARDIKCCRFVTYIQKQNLGFMPLIARNLNIDSDILSYDEVILAIH